MWVLTYHSISSGPPPLCIPAERLAGQLDFLLEAGWKATALRDCVDEIQERREDPSPRFAVTFDDGYRDFAEAALPALEARGVPATVFAVASEDRQHLARGIGAPLLEREALRELAERGVEIGAHGIEHVDLCGLEDAALGRELHEGRERLAEWVAAPVETFAYPFGSYDARVRAEVANEFRAAFTTQLARVPSAPDPFAIPRVDAFYLDDPWLRRALRRGFGELYLLTRRWLRRARGSEPRRAIPTRATAAGIPLAPAGVRLQARYRPWL